MFDLLKWIEDAPIKLASGVGDPETGGCWMAGLSIYSGASWGDHPPCVDFESGLGELCIRLNDMISSDVRRGQIIGPHLLAPVGTATRDLKVIELRKWHLIDAAIRRFAPYALRAAGLEAAAFKLENIPKVVAKNSVASAAAHADACAAAHAASHAAAYAAAYAVARSDACAAADAAACAAAHAVAHPAARSAACAAAHAVAAHAAGDHAAGDHVSETIVLPVILEMCAIGSTVPVEPSCSEMDIKRALQCV